MDGQTIAGPFSQNVVLANHAILLTKRIAVVEGNPERPVDCTFYHSLGMRYHIAGNFGKHYETACEIKKMVI